MAKREKVLLFFTGLYPFGRQEAFIENEISFLAESFDRVYVLPQFTAPSSREVPANVNVRPLPEIRGVKKSIIIIFRAFLSGIFWKNIGEVIAGGDIVYRLRTLASYVSLASIYRDFLVGHVIPELGTEVDVYLYSYWMDRNALTMFLLRENITIKKAVSRVHGFDVYEERNPDSYLPLRKMLLRSVDTIYSISADAINYLRERYPDISNCEISRLGTTRGCLFEALQNSNVFHIISVSNVIFLKRVDLILKSIFYFAARLPMVQVRWTHFGDGPLFDALKQEVAAINLPNLIIDLRGGQLNAVVKQFYEQTPIDLFINLSESEGIPVSFMEAMSYGVPVLATNVGGVGEILDSSCGYLLAEDVTAELVADRIFEIASDRSRLRAHSARALAVWHEKYSADVTYPRFCRQLLSEG